MPPSLWLKLLLLQASKCYLGVCVCLYKTPAGQCPKQPFIPIHDSGGVFSPCAQVTVGCVSLRKKQQQTLRQIRASVAHLSPLPLVMLTSFSMPPVSARAFAFSMFLLVTSCRVQQMAATVSSDSRVVFPPGRRLTRSLIAYFPKSEEGRWDVQEIHCDTLTVQHVCRQMLMHGEGRGVPLIQVWFSPPLCYIM